MDQVEEQLDYGDEDHGGGSNNNRIFHGGGGGGGALAEDGEGEGEAEAEAEEDEEIPDDEEYDDLYQDVNVGFIEPEPQEEAALGSQVQIPPPTLQPSVPVSVPGLDPVQETRFPEIRTRVSELMDTQGAALSSSTAVDDDGVNSKRVFRPPPGLELRPLTRAGGESTSGPGGGGGRGGGGSATGTPTSTPRSARGDYDYPLGGSGGGGGSTVFVGELQWWTTDADLEAALSEYGRVKEIKFFEERASGKSKGYCQVHFYDSNAARACKEGMNGRIFNGRPCVVAYKSPRTVKQMGEAMTAHRSGGIQERRMMNDGGGGGGGGGGGSGGGGGGGGGGRGGSGSYHGGSGGDVGRNYGRTGRGSYGQGRGPGGQGRGRSGKVGGRSGGGNNVGGHYGQGLLGPIGMQPGGMMPPMGNQGFDPGFGPQMGRGGGGGGGYGGFGGPHGPPFPGMMPSFPPVGSVGLPGVAPHVNPAFFGRGMSANGMAMMASGGGGGGNSSGGGMEGHQGMWSEWSGEGVNRRVGDSSHVDDVGSEYGYGGYGGEKVHDRGGGGGGGAGRSSASRMRERVPENDWVGNSEKRHRSDRDVEWERERDRYRDKERDGYRDVRERELNWDRDDDYGRERAARPRSKSRAIEEEDQRNLADYVKRRR